MKVGITFSSFDLFQGGHVKTLEHAKQEYYYLVCGLQIGPALDRLGKNETVQFVVDRYIQLNGCKYVDEIVHYATNKI